MINKGSKGVSHTVVTVGRCLALPGEWACSRTKATRTWILENEQEMLRKVAGWQHARQRQPHRERQKGVSETGEIKQLH